MTSQPVSRQAIQSPAPLAKDAAQAVAERASMLALFNCLLKEFALPQGLASQGWPSEPLALPLACYRQAQAQQAKPLLVTMPNGLRLLALADRYDTLGSQAFIAAIYLKRPGAAWGLCGFGEFVQALLEACSAAGDNRELLSQILASCQFMRAIIAANPSTKGDPSTGGLSPQDDPLADYLASEQSLWFGHPSHPAPKARIWPQGLDEARFAPEFRQPLQLHLLEVPAAGLWIGTNDLAHAEALAALADQRRAPPGRAIIAMHPTQAELFLRDYRVMDLLRNGEVRDLGRSGYTAYPTASVRTLYIPDGHYFIKGSLNIRITNCVRKNAWYELESALAIDAILARLVREQPATTGGLQPVPEPAAVSWCPVDASDADRIWFREQTGVILRHNFCRQWGEPNCVMAATLFGRTLELTPHVQDFISRQGGSLASDALLIWFKRYAEALLRPVLHLFFNHGLIFEPHLQNTVIIHRQGQPVDVLLRDYEGVKLSAELGMALAPAGLHPRVRQSLEYPRTQGWNRIAYCLFINNLSEAVLALSWRRPALAQPMWAQVRQTLEVIAHELPAPAPELDHLLCDGLIPCKTNFKTRLAAVADRQAGYSWLRAPWTQSGPSTENPLSGNPGAENHSTGIHSTDNHKEAVL